MLCKELGANVTIYERQDKVEFNKVRYERIKQLGVNIEFNKFTSRIDLTKENRDLIVLSPSLDYSFVKVALNQKLNTEVIGEVELGYRYSDAPIIAVTGTNGKTTTTDIINKLLSTSYKTLMAGNMGIGFAEKIKQNKYNFIVLEVGAAHLESTRKFRPKISVITNVTSEHLDRYICNAEYKKLKQKILTNQTIGDFSILNYDNKFLRSISTSLDCKVIYFSATTKLREGAYIQNNKICYNDTHNEYEIMELNNVKNKGNIDNFLASICVAFITKINLNCIKNVLTTYTGLEHRLEYVQSNDGINYYNDSKATNPEATVHALKTLSPKKMVLITGGKSDKNSDFSTLIQSILKNVKFLILIGEVAEKLKLLATNAGFPQNCIYVADSLKEALLISKQKAMKSDNVLFSPGANSRDMFDNHYQRGILFTNLVKELLGS